jgi:hypothetical protein
VPGANKTASHSILFDEGNFLYHSLAHGLGHAEVYPRGDPRSILIRTAPDHKTGTRINKLINEDRDQFTADVSYGDVDVTLARHGILDLDTGVKGVGEIPHRENRDVCWDVHNRWRSYSVTAEIQDIAEHFNSNKAVGTSWIDIAAALKVRGYPTDIVRQVYNIRIICRMMRKDPSSVIARTTCTVVIEPFSNHYRVAAINLNGIGITHKWIASIVYSPPFGRLKYWIRRRQRARLDSTALSDKGPNIVGNQCDLYPAVHKCPAA